MNNNMPAKGGSVSGGKVLIISIDKGLLGKGQLGDVIERHRKYGEFCDRLDVVVLSLRGFEIYNISDKITSYPTNSHSKIEYFFDALNIGKNLFKKNKYDLIVVQDPFITGLVGWKLKRKFNAKLLVNFHGDFWQNKNWLKEKWYNYILNLLQKFILKKADALRVMSEGQKEKFLQTGWMENKIRVISTPVDLQKFIKNESYSIESNNLKTILHIGRDDEVKDFDTLVKAFKLVKERILGTSFIQAGAGKELQQSMNKNNFQDICLKGNISHQELIGLYYQATVFILSSTSESFGKVLVESNACSRPVVSTATTGAKEIIEDGVNGFLVAVGDYKELADKIIWLLEHPIEAKKMGDSGRKLVEERYGNNTQKIIDFWKDIIKNNF